MYQLLPNNWDGTPVQAVRRVADNAFIPFDDANTDFVEYKKWLAEGNQPLPADEQE